METTTAIAGPRRGASTAGAAAGRGQRRPPSASTAVVAGAAGDSALLGALQVLKAAGRRVPAGVALAGFSNEGFTLITEPRLTSVDQYCEEMGQAAVRLLLGLPAGPGHAAAQRRVVLPPELLVRESLLRTPV